MNEFWFCFVLLLKIGKISWNSYKKHILSEHLSFWIKLKTKKMEVESVLAIKWSRLMGKPMSTHMKSWNEIKPNSTTVRISPQMAWMTKQTNKQPPHVDVMTAWLIRRVLVNFSTHNSRCDRSKADLGADFAEPRCDPQVKGSVTGNKREAWGGVVSQ